MAIICIVIFWIFMALRPANAQCSYAMNDVVASTAMFLARATVLPWDTMERIPITPMHAQGRIQQWLPRR
jgi:hypothetical protein